MARNPAPQEPYDPPTVPSMFIQQAAHFGDHVLKTSKINGVWTPTTWCEAYANLRRATMGLLDRGIRKGDRVGIVSRTRSEWSDADMAALTARAGGGSLPRRAPGRCNTSSATARAALSSASTTRPSTGYSRSATPRASPSR